MHERRFRKQIIGNYVVFSVKIDHHKQENKSEMNFIETMKRTTMRLHRTINHEYMMGAAAVYAMLFLSACDGSGGVGKSEHCTCPKPKVTLYKEMAMENVAGIEITGFSADGDMKTVKYILGHKKLKESIPFPRWDGALTAAIQNGHVQIAELLMKEMPEEFLKEIMSRPFSGRDDWGLRYVIESGTCDSLRFIFKHAGDKIENPLNSIGRMSNCKLQACIEFGFLNDKRLKSLKEENKDLIAAVMSGIRVHRIFKRVLVDKKWQRSNPSEEKVRENQQAAEEAVAMVKCLLDNGYRPTRIDIDMLKQKMGAEQEEETAAKERILKLLEKYK